MLMYLQQHLANEDLDVWRCLCFRDFPRSEGQYEKGEFPEPESWRDQYVVGPAASSLGDKNHTSLFLNRSAVSLKKSE